MGHQGNRELQLSVVRAVMGNSGGWRQEDPEELLSQLGQGREGLRKT